MKKLHIVTVILLALAISAHGHGQGSQLPKYTVATLPAASSQITYTVQVIDGTTNTDCVTGGATGTARFNVLCAVKWNGSAYVWSPINTQAGGNGITQLIDDVLAGPGNGSQAATLPVRNDTPGTCGDATHVCQSTTNAKGLTTHQIPIAISASGGINPALTPPIAGQFVIVYPTAVSLSAGTSGALSVVPSTSTKQVAFTNTKACSLGGGSITATFSGLDVGLAALGIPLANVTHVYPFAYSADPPGGVERVCGPIGSFLAGPTAENLSISGNATGLSSVTLGPPSTASSYYATGELVGVNPGNIPTALFAVAASVAGTGLTSASSGAFVGWYVYYSGAPVVQPNTVQVKLPLTYNTDTGELGIDIPLDTSGLDTGTTNAYGMTVPWLVLNFNTTVKFQPANTSTSTTPTFALNGGEAMPIVGPTGGALAVGDLALGVPATIIYGTGYRWYLQNPQTASGGGSTVNVNGSAVSNPNFNQASPSPDANYAANKYKVSGSNVINETPYADASTFGVIKPDGTTCTTTAGVLTCSGGGSGFSVNTQTGPNVTIHSSDASVTVTTTTNDIDLTTAGGSGVQYNTDPVLLLTFSGAYDDNDSNSRTVGVPSSVSCTGTHPTICTVAMTAHGFTATTNAVDMSNLASWPASPAGAVQQSAQFGSFQIATIPDANHFTFTTPTALTYSCSPCTGNIYDASLWAIWHLAAEPYFFGHSTVYGIETTTQGAAAGLATWVAGMTPAPKQLIDMTGVNDLAAGRTVSQINADRETEWAAAHTAGMKVAQATIPPAQYGLTGQGTNPSQLNDFIWSKISPTATMLANGKYFDRFIDIAKAYSDAPDTLPSPAVTTIFGKNINLSMSAQDGLPLDSPDDTYYSINGLGGNKIPMHHTGNYEYFSDSSYNIWMAWIANGSATLDGLNLYGLTGNNPVFHMLNSVMTAGQDWCPSQIGTAAVGTNNSFVNCFHYAGSGSTSNYLSIAPYAAAAASIRFYGDGEVVLPNIATSASTAPACFNGTLGGLTNVGCATSAAFSAITSGTNIAAAMAVGSGASLAPTGTGTIQATNIASTVAVTAPITVTGSGTTASPYTIGCATCGTGSGGTSVSQNSGSAETNLPITGHMPQVCSDTSGSGTAQSCTVANTFVPQAGNCMVYQTTTANSGTGLTVNVNSFGAKSVAVAGSSGWTTTLVASSSIPANKPMNICYDGTNWNASGTGFAASAGSAGAWTNGTSSLTSTGCGTNTGGVCTISGTTTTDVQFSSIPAHNRMQIVFYGQGSVTGGQASAGYLYYQFNGDTASHYQANGITQPGTSASSTNAYNSGIGCDAGQIGAAGVSHVITDIPFYADATFTKTASSVNVGGQDLSGNTWYSTLTCGWITTPAAITTVDVKYSGAGGHFVAGSKIMVLFQD